MLRRVIFTALLAACGIGEAAERARFSGFYLGASAGATAVVVKNDIKIEPSDLKTMREARNRVIGLVYGVMGGYGHNFNGFYLGAEIGAQADTTNKSKTYKWDFSVGAVTQSILFKAKYERSPVLSIAPRLGVVFNGSYMAYVKPALELSSDRAVFIGLDDGEKTRSKKKFRYSFSPSIGLEKIFTNNVLLRVEYNYNFGAKCKVTDTIHDEHGNSGLATTSLKYTSQAIRFGCAYLF